MPVTCAISGVTGRGAAPVAQTMSGHAATATAPAVMAVNRSCWVTRQSRQRPVGGRPVVRVVIVGAGSTLWDGRGVGLGGGAAAGALAADPPVVAVDVDTVGAELEGGATGERRVPAARARWPWPSPWTEVLRSGGGGGAVGGRGRDRATPGR